MGQCYRYRETRENLVPCSRCQARHTALFRMSETWKVETCREEEQEDSCSSCSSYLLFEGSDDTEIITIGEDRVPGVPSEIDRLFLLERILGSYQLALERLSLGQVDGGASDPAPQDHQDEDKAQDTQDTQETPDTQVKP